MNINTLISILEPTLNRTITQYKDDGDIPTYHNPTNKTLTVNNNTYTPTRIFLIPRNNNDSRLGIYQNQTTLEIKITQITTLTLQ